MLGNVFTKLAQTFVKPWEGSVKANINNLVPTDPEKKVKSTDFNLTSTGMCVNDKTKYLAKSI